MYTDELLFISLKSECNTFDSPTDTHALYAETQTKNRHEHYGIKLSI